MRLNLVTKEMQGVIKKQKVGKPFQFKTSCLGLALLHWLTRESKD